MKKGLIISDAGPIFSLAIVDQLNLLDELFLEVIIPRAVWIEITRDKTTEHYHRITSFFVKRVRDIDSNNDLTFVMDYGESEAVILYREMKADFLLIDDRKARKIAENFGIQCIGTIGILSNAREKGLVNELRPIFKTFLNEKRYYSIKLLNAILQYHHEATL